MTTPESVAPVVPSLGELDTSQLVEGYFKVVAGDSDLIGPHSLLFDLAEGPGAMAVAEGWYDYTEYATEEQKAHHEAHQRELVRRAAIRLGILAIDSGEVKE